MWTALIKWNLKFIWTIFKHSLPSSQKTNCVFVTKPIGECCLFWESYSIHKHTLYYKKWSFLILKQVVHKRHDLLRHALARAYISTIFTCLTSYFSFGNWKLYSFDHIFHFWRKQPQQSVILCCEAVIIRKFSIYLKFSDAARIWRLSFCICWKVLLTERRKNSP